MRWQTGGSTTPDVHSCGTSYFLRIDKTPADTITITCKLPRDTRMICLLENDPCIDRYMLFFTDAKARKSTRLVLTHMDSREFMQKDKVIVALRTRRAVTLIGLAQLYLDPVLYWNQQYPEYTGLLVPKCDWGVSGGYQVGQCIPDCLKMFIPSSEPNTIHHDS